MARTTPRLRGTAAARGARRPAKQFPIVGIGASAGGLEAFTTLLRHLPADTGMAYVLVQHLDPTHKSMLAEILSRATAMPVVEARSRMPIQPNHVYVGAENAEVAFVDGRFAVETRPRRAGRARQLPIDRFLKSLAEQRGSRAIGVILSGTLSDGALGLRAIKMAGGLTFAQDEATARFRDMPRAAIAAGVVDFVLAPEKIARELARFGRHPYADLVPPEAAAPAADGHDHAGILALLRSSSGVDFSHYRQTTVKRRMARRMALARIDSTKTYLQLLRSDPAERRALYEDILITVTSFFRDPEVFRSLTTSVLPSLLRGRDPESPIRVWVPGCATGEEVYSIAICLFECLQRRHRHCPIQIFATDVSEASVEKARTGAYTDSDLQEISAARLKRFFTKTDRGWQIVKSVRDVCVFAKQNIASDPPFSGLDLISCRNLLIYLEPVLQKRVLPLFHYALKPGGYLMLGSAESISGFRDLFAPVDRNHRIFVKRPGSARASLEFVRTPAPRLAGAAPPIEKSPAVDPQKEADRLVLGRYGPAGVLITDDYEVVQFRGRTAPYLEVPPGAASLNVLKMAREGVLSGLRAAILKARKSGRTVRAERLKVRQDGGFREVNLEVSPVKGGGKGARFWLVLFEEARARKPAAERVPNPAPGRARHETIVELEQELTATKEYLQATIEEQEASNEELKSANEEILSSNEELQSTNEELETAKEELQSTNEELSTVNEELQNRNLELNRLNNDLANLLTGTHLAILMLGTDGRLRRFTAEAEKLFNLIPTDAGRRIGDLKSNLHVPDFEALVKGVVTSLTPLEREVQDVDGRWYLMRVRPYLTLDSRVDGAVLAFVDIDPLKRTLEQAHAARDYAEALVETVRESLVVLDEKLRVRAANKAFYRTFPVTPLQTEGKFLFDLWRWREQDRRLFEALEQVVASPEPLQDLESRLATEGLGERTLLFNARRVRVPGEPRPLILVAIDDITKRKQAEAELRASEARYRRIFETAREGIWILDGESGEILDVNTYLVDMLVLPREQLVGRRPWEIGIAGDPEALRRGFSEAASRGFHFEPQLEMRAETGQRIVIEAISHVYELGSRRVVQSNLRDVSERTRMLDQLRQVQKLDSIGNLAGGVAHDFNNILNIISAHLTRLTRAQPELPRGSVESIEKAIERGSGVVKQLLTFARKTESSFSPTDVNAIAREVASLVQETFPKNIEIDMQLGADVPAIRADGNQIHQALVNLAVNARDAMPHGGQLTIRTDRVPAEALRERHLEPQADAYVGVHVQDTGAGMTEETRRRLFEPFFTTKRAGGARGLGLAVVYGIVNGHHALIDVDTEVGRGSTFDLFFAVPAEGAETSGLPDASGAPLSSSRARREKRRGAAAAGAARSSSSKTRKCCSPR